MTASAAEDLSLPDPLTTSAGDKVTTPAEWQQTRRPELIELFRTHVYGLFGLKGVGAQAPPKPDEPLQTGQIGYHLRTGKHDLTEYDWNRYMDFADKHWKKGQQSPAGDSPKAAPDE